MGDAAAASRARAYRDRKKRHDQGDHSRCVLGKCVVITPDAVTSHVTPDEPVTPPESSQGLGARGQALWDELTASWTPSPLQRELLIEACRMADRLEKLDGHLKGREWLRFRVSDEEGTEVKVYVDGVLRAVRELQGEFRMAVADLVKAMPVKQEPKKGGGVLADLAAKRAARSVNAAG